jgi:hypothetical protein
MKAFVVLFFLSCCSLSFGQDPFADKMNAEQNAAKAKVKADKDAAAKLRQDNSISVPAELLAKLKDREWKGYLVNSLGEGLHKPEIRVTGKLVKVYYSPAAQDRIIIASIAVRTKKGETEFAISTDDAPNVRYVQLAVEKLYHGKMRLPWKASK